MLVTESEVVRMQSISDHTARRLLTIQKSNVKYPYTSLKFISKWDFDKKNYRQ